jgi:uroporphyrinogen decarboxylase
MSDNPDGRARFLETLSCRPTDRPPVWIMRQAGRTLPEYRALRAESDFLTVMRTPKLAAEVTLQPIRRFGMDAAVIFCDILIIPEAMGLDLTFGPAGPVLSPPIVDDFELDSVDPATDFPYLGDALQRVRAELGENQAVLGFAGAPFTLACYMVERLGKKDFPGVKRFFYQHPERAQMLMNALADAVADTLIYQLENGADAVQLFDTWAGLLSPQDYATYAHPANKRVVDRVRAAGGKILLYLRNGAHLTDQAIATGASGLAVDWRVDLPSLAKRVSANTVLQGNLDPALLLGPPALVKQRVIELHQRMEGRPGHIFNLGHGLKPFTPIEGIGAFVDAVRGL